MRHRKYFALSLIVLLISANYGLARNIDPRTARITPEEKEFELAAREFQSRQAGDFGSLLSIGIKVFPILMKAIGTFTGGDGSGIGGGLLEAISGTSAALSSDETPTPDRIDTLDTVGNDPFSWSNLLSMGIKVALAVFSSYANDDIDRNDVGGGGGPSLREAVLGTVISALTGSESPQEVAVMAKQANEVLNLLMTLVEALQTSFIS